MTNKPFSLAVKAVILDTEALRKGPVNAGETMAGVAGLEPVTSAVTGQRSNQLSYTPAQSERQTYGNRRPTSSRTKKEIRAADAKEVGVGNPAEETYCYPNTLNVGSLRQLSTVLLPISRWVPTRF
jgi:hypothetical protein